MQRVQEHFLLVELGRRGRSLAYADGGGVVAADDLLTRGLAAGFIVDDCACDHVDAHVRWALVGALAVDGAEHGLEDRENFNVAVIVDRRHAVSVQMEGVDHVHVR